MSDAFYPGQLDYIDRFTYMALARQVAGADLFAATS